MSASNAIAQLNSSIEGFEAPVTTNVNSVKSSTERMRVTTRDIYEKIETLRSLEGYIDIYLPDLKYYSSNLSGKFSNCKDYFPVALSAVKEMLRQTGKAKFDDEGKLLCGTVVRHLVLPNCYKDSIKIFDELEKEVDTQKVVVSVMCQYFPTNRAGEFSELSRKTTTLEYMKVVERVRKINFAQGFIQDKSSANEIYVPIFDY